MLPSDATAYRRAHHRLLPRAHAVAGETVKPPRRNGSLHCRRLLWRKQAIGPIVLHYRELSSLVVVTVHLYPSLETPMPLYIKLDFDKDGNVSVHSSTDRSEVESKASYKLTAKTIKQALTELRNNVGQGAQI